MNHWPRRKAMKKRRIERRRRRRCVHGEHGQGSSVPWPEAGLGLRISCGMSARSPRPALTLPPGQVSQKNKIPPLAPAHLCGYLSAPEGIVCRPTLTLPFPFSLFSVLQGQYFPTLAATALNMPGLLSFKYFFLGARKRMNGQEKYVKRSQAPLG